jgi:amino-acid N-acetyltransferase
LSVHPLFPLIAQSASPMPESPPKIQIRSAKLTDKAAVAALISPFVAERKLLPRTEAELEQLLRTGFAAEFSGRIVGFASIEIYSRKLAEILCLAVESSYHGTGVGRMLVQACVQLARDQKVLEVMAVSSSEKFFQNCGFDFTLPEEKKAFFYRFDRDSQLPGDGR